MSKNFYLKITRSVYSNAFSSIFDEKQRISRYLFNRNFHRSSICFENTLVFENRLKEVFSFKGTNVSNWIIENKALGLCLKYRESTKDEKHKILHILASKYAVQHDSVCKDANKLLSTEPNNEKQMVSYERQLKIRLTPDYQWLFVIIGRLENGVKFLVDLRTDVLDLLSATRGIDEYVVIQQLNIILQDLLLLWFSVGFLHLERITWQSSCDIMEKISEGEAIHPIRNWLDLKQRVGPYRRCYIFTHPSMPREPLVVLHTALCDSIPDSRKGIEEAQARILGSTKKEITYLDEDKSKITAVIFYSITSTQKGLKGIELGNYLIKDVANEVMSEFPMVSELSTLSPIPNFRQWFLEKVKQDPNLIFTREEYEAMRNVLKEDNIALGLKKVFNNCLWTNEEEFCKILEKPMLKACAWYLYKEKRRNYCLNRVANFHLRNGAVMWRINWMADPSPRGVENSCGMMVNYRYYMKESEDNSRNYIQNYFVNASENVINLAAEYGNFT